MKTIILDNIRIPVKQAYEEGLDTSVRHAVGVRMRTIPHNFIGLYKKSIDARKKSEVRYVVSALVDADDSIDMSRLKNSRPYPIISNEIIIPGRKTLEHRPVVVGSGPCGLLCAYTLASMGYEPLVIERGSDIDRRSKSVADFWKGGELDTETNVQFGEGGAGTFSDGKLVTRINDSRCLSVTDLFIKHGASESIRFEAKPHIGTDILIPVIRGIREEIISMGGTFMFNTRLTDISYDNKLKSIRINDETDIPADILILAIGHSARDTYTMLFEKGLEMKAKPFSAGVRIEHPREDVNQVQWGDSAIYMDSAAEYSASARVNGRGIYTFCMCPGGVVVNASSEEGHLVVNGMSYSARNGRNSNSAWVAEVRPRDMGSDHPLAGVEFQRYIEKRSYSAGNGYIAPVQRMEDFIKGRTSGSFGGVRPSYTGNTTFSDLNDILPEFITDTMKEALGEFQKKLPFFNNQDAILTGCETRTSAPLRIQRSSECESESHPGIFPAGEGAGYAGGIMSAAADGIKVAESIIRRYNYSG